MEIPPVVRTIGMAVALLGLLGAACGDESPAQVSTPGITDAVPDAPTPPTRPANPKVGDVIPTGEGSVAVLGIDRFGSAGRLFSPPKGRDYFAAEVKACSGPNEKGLSFSPRYFLLELADKTVADPTLGIKRPELRTAEVPAGGCLSGWVTFTIPEKADPAFVVYDGSERFRWQIPPAEGEPS